MEMNRNVFQLLENNREFGELLFQEKMFLSFVVDLLGIFKVYKADCKDFVSALESIAEIQLIPKETVISNPSQILSIFARSGDVFEQLGINCSFAGEENDWEIVLESNFSS